MAKTIFLYDLKMDNWDAAIERYGDNLSEGLEYYCGALAKLTLKDKKNGVRPDNYKKWLQRLVTTECMEVIFLYHIIILL
jgi:hypothetical protein